MSTSTLCRDCIHLPRCRWLLQRTGEETECDWSPSRFVAVGERSISAPDVEDEVLVYVDTEVSP